MNKKLLSVIASVFGLLIIFIYLNFAVGLETWTKN